MTEEAVDLVRTYLTRLADEEWEQAAIQAQALDKESVATREPEDGTLSSAQTLASESISVSGASSPYADPGHAELPSVLGTLVHRVFETDLLCGRV